MPSTDEIYPSSYLKADDIKKPELKLTLKSVGPKEVGRDEKKKTTLVADFTEIEKEWVINKTNADKLVELLGTKDYTAWPGARVTLVVAWTSFGKDTVKAIRVVAAERQGSSPAPAVQHDLGGGKG